MKASDNAIAPIIIRRPDKKIFQIRIVGDSSLIVHAWSEKAKKRCLHLSRARSS